MTDQYAFRCDFFWNKKGTGWMCVAEEFQHYGMICNATEDDIRAKNIIGHTLMRSASNRNLLLKSPEPEPAREWSEPGDGVAGSNSFKASIWNSECTQGFGIEWSQKECQKVIEEFEGKEICFIPVRFCKRFSTLHEPSPDIDKFPLLSMLEEKVLDITRSRMDVAEVDYGWDNVCQGVLKASKNNGGRSWATDLELGMELAKKDDSDDSRMAAVYALLLLVVTVRFPFQNLPDNDRILDLNEELAEVYITIRYGKEFNASVHPSCRSITICILKDGEEKSSEGCFTLRWEMLRDFIGRLKKEEKRMQDAEKILPFVQGLHSEDSIVRLLDDYLAETIYGYM